MNEQTIKKVTQYCVKFLDFKKENRGCEYFYSSMPLCAVDAVFSINARYEAVKNVMINVCNYLGIAEFAKQPHEFPSKEFQLSTTKFLEKLKSKNYDQLADDVYKNHQRTSPRNGILKAEATVKFLKVLQNFKAEYFQDIAKLINDKEFEKAIKEIPGQASGISLKYFFMLAGDDNTIKPDRMIKRFLYNITGTEFGDIQCQEIISSVTEKLNDNHLTTLNNIKITPKQLDHIIWDFQRAQR